LHSNNENNTEIYEVNILAVRQLNPNFLGELFNGHSTSVSNAIASLASSQHNAEVRGAVFTRPEVVNFILDLIGYTEDQPLHKKRILEPSFGSGSFLLITISRLIAAWRANKNSNSVFEDLSNSIRAVELHSETFSSTRDAVIVLLKQQGFSDKTSRALTDCWLVQGDFLLTQLEGQFDFVVGNPPYVRQELIPQSLLAEYKKLYTTIYDRADLYIPFIEKSLSSIVKGGCLGFICSDRWMKNRYGGPLRGFVSKQFHLKVYVDMVGTLAFQEDVTAYPAILIISRETPGATRIAHRPEVNKEILKALSKELLRKKLPKKTNSVREITSVTNSTDPWLFSTDSKMLLIRNLEQKFPRLEDTGCKVGIGVATGADKAFISDFNSLEVEPDRKLPLVTTKDITSGEVKWKGEGIINPFSDSGELVNLQTYPMLRAYLEERRNIIANRHCAKKSPTQWYRTIDRITPSLASTPKLLIPDIKGNTHVVFEGGRFYPHHNLYFITSKDWDLRALQAILLSAITHLFVSAYSTQMRGGYFRFQAQYLRRVCIPHWKNVPESLKLELREAAISRNVQACNTATFKLYGLNKQEISIFEEEGE
jgi:hypothetical protein